MLNITKGKINRAQKVVIYGPEGIGKSSLAARFPDPVIIDTEGGTAHMDVRRIDKPQSWEELLSIVKEVAATPGICKTLVIDTADWAEQLITTYLCNKYKQNSIESFGYNVQPGVDLNYVTGDNEISDITFGAENILSFPDLIREMKKHLEILFEGQKNTGTYTSMISRILSIESEVRNVDDGKRNAAQIYIAMKQYQYEYFDVLKTYVPLLLAKEDFFESAFK